MSTEAGRGLAERATMGPSSTASVAAATLVGPAPGAGWLDRGWRRVRTFSNFEPWDRMEPVPSDGP